MSTVCAEGTERSAVWLQGRKQKEAEQAKCEGEGSKALKLCIHMMARNIFCGINFSLN